MAEVIHLEGLRRIINAWRGATLIDEDLFAIITTTAFVPLVGDVTMVAAQAAKFDGTFAAGVNGTANPLVITGANVSIVLDSGELELRLSGDVAAFGACSAATGTAAGYVTFYVEDLSAGSDSARYPLVSHAITVQPVVGDNYNHVTDPNGILKIKLA